MNTVCATGPKIFGVDVSHWQQHINWGTLRASGAMFAFLKCTEGVANVDKSFADNWAHAKTVGLARGAYHFFHPNLDPVAQAAHFINAMGPLGPDDLPPVCDWERADGTTAKFDMAAGAKFLEEVERLTGRIPVIYGSPYFLRDLNLDVRFARYALWIAHYDVVCPLMPPPWTTWQFWQESSSRMVAGIANRCDFSYFNGSGDQLKAFIAASVAPIASVVLPPVKSSAKSKKA